MASDAMAVLSCLWQGSMISVHRDRQLISTELGSEEDFGTNGVKYGSAGYAQFFGNVAPILDQTLASTPCHDRILVGGALNPIADESSICTNRTYLTDAQDAIVLAIGV